MSLPNLFRLKNAYKFSMVQAIILYVGAKKYSFGALMRRGKHPSSEIVALPGFCLNAWFYQCPYPVSHLADIFCLDIHFPWTGNVGDKELPAQ